MADVTVSKPSAEDAPAEDAPTSAAFHAVLVLENEPSGDGRFINEGALTWRTPPLPLMWQRSNEERHRGAVIVGRIDELWRSGNEIHASGIFDLGSPDGREAHRLVSEQIQRWVSIDADQLEIAEEELFEEGDDFRVVISAARVMGATICSFPAFPAAVIALADHTIGDATPDGRPAASPPSLAADIHFGEVNFGSFKVSDAPWSPSASRFTDTEWMASTASAEHLSDSTISDHFLPHHEPSGALSRRGLHLAAHRFSTIRRRNKQAARDHLAAHFTQDLHEPVPDILQSSALVAAANLRRPPVAWFSNPALLAPTPITITRDGRIYGHAALWNTCHIAYPGVCKTAPRSRTSYSYFLTGAVEVNDPNFSAADDEADGGCGCATVATGPITLGTGHAHLHANPDAARHHYDNTGSAIADVAVGEDSHGIWVSGALRPDVTESQRIALRGSALSGDWRPIGGGLELVALLAVNVPGFPVPRLAMGLLDGQQVSLVAAGIPDDEPPADDPIPSGITAEELLEELKKDISSTDDKQTDPDDPTDLDDNESPADNPDDAPVDPPVEASTP